ncbi:MAG: 23S rRNA (guanosine(2251)-2'-O)-methyltransferase RlmB, partial [Gammaproteobacteria bacterium]|nr:23S rRNA (guanosine(2251)-2'-O)-methyltransferase RlmB [Gammaproteobacteria bacterium]
MGQRVLYGIHAVRQLLLGRPETVDCVYLQAGLGAEREARLAEVLPRAVRVRRVPAEELERLTGTVKHQGVAATANESGPLAEAAG